MAARRFEFEEGTSSKFWTVELDGKSVKVTFGRIGSTGQEKTKAFSHAIKAARGEAKLIAEKLAKGYKEVTGAAKNEPDEEEDDRPQSRERVRGERVLLEQDRGCDEDAAGNQVRQRQHHAPADPVEQRT